MRRCADCNLPISAIRLAALPEVTTCIRCQEKLDRPVNPFDVPGLAVMGELDNAVAEVERRCA